MYNLIVPAIEACCLYSWHYQIVHVLHHKSKPMVVCLFVVVLHPSNIYISNVISGRVTTCDSAHSWQLYSTASLGHKAAVAMTCYPTQSHYPDTEPTGSRPILIMLSARLRSERYQIKIIGLTPPEFELAWCGFEAVWFAFSNLPA